MNRASLALVLSLAAASPVSADLPLVGDGEIPQKMTSVEADGIHVFTRTALEEHRFTGFSLGGSTDLPATEADRLRGLLRDLGPNQWLFVQATADTTRWHRRRRKEDHRLDVTVALSRTVWGFDQLDRRRITTLPPRLDDTERGLLVQVATYAEEVLPFPSPPPPPAPVAAPLAGEPGAGGELEPPTFAIGLEGGVGTLHTADISMTTPTIDLVLEKAEVRLDLGVGWWTADENQLGDLANGTAKGTLSWFPRGGWLGPFVGWVAGSQFVRSVTEYVLFAHGPAVGAIARGREWPIDAALRVGYARVNVDELQREQRWSNAFVFTVQVGKVF
jgi:hypothetical protein